MSTSVGIRGALAMQSALIQNHRSTGGPSAGLRICKRTLACRCTKTAWPFISIKPALKHESRESGVVEAAGMRPLSRLAKPLLSAVPLGLTALSEHAAPALAVVETPVSFPEAGHPVEALWQLADLDPSVAKIFISILGPLFAVSTFLFIIRIVMSWYPQLPATKFPYVIAYAPTEPVLGPTRRLIPPIGGVDISPVLWLAFISFSNEILLGQQGLLVLLAEKRLGSL